jgi:hypothetical protein
MTSIAGAFNQHFMELVEDISSSFPDDVDIASAKNSFILIKKANPKLLIKAWDSFVVSKYKSQIENGDISYFLNKDYSEDISASSSSKQISEAIDRLRRPIREMNSQEQLKIIKYMQNLSKLTDMYNAQSG